MKRFFLSGVAIAACLGLATTASAQYGTNYRYSSYGYAPQEQSPSDAPSIPVPPSVVPNQPVAPQGSGSVNQGSASSSLGSASRTPAPAYIDNSCGPDCAPSTYQPYQPGPATGCDTGACGSAYFGAGNYAGNYGGSYGGGCQNGGCGLGHAGGLGHGHRGPGHGSLIRSNDKNIVFGLRGLIFERNYEDDRGLGALQANPTGGFFTTDADHDFFGGFEATLGVRNCTGTGWEFTYWGLFPDDATTDFGPGPFFTNLDFSTLELPVGNVLNFFNNAQDWRLTRNTEIQNLEFNLLRNAGQTRGLFGGSTNFEWLAGVRFLQFTEDLTFQAINGAQSIDYLTATENDLVGFQIGARMDRCLGKRFSLALGTKFGVYNNTIEAHQQINDGAGNIAQLTTGPIPFQLGSDTEQVSTIGELDLGLNYQFSQTMRANFGYRVVGVSNVALAADQIPFNFDDSQEAQRIKTNGNLLLQGVYFGLEKSF